VSNGVYNYPSNPVAQARGTQTHRILKLDVGSSRLDSFLNCYHNKILIGSLLTDVGIPSLKNQGGGCEGAPKQLSTPLLSRSIFHLQTSLCSCTALNTANPLYLYLYLFIVPQILTRHIPTGY